MVQAPAKSNGSGVVVNYRLSGAIAAGQPLTVAFRFEGVTDPGGATVRMVADGGLRLLEPPATVELKAGQPTSINAIVVPAEGLGYLHVFTTQNGLESVTSIAVGSGKDAASLPGRSELKQMPDGEKIFSIPVK
ncbi:conserved hypothetical protein [Burkholderiales bacterium 8X]|nr:conserved hypothetical protein [Burkholderiales bacterium 8X]